MFRAMIGAWVMLWCAGCAIQGKPSPYQYLEELQEQPARLTPAGSPPPFTPDPTAEYSDEDWQQILKMKRLEAN